MLLRRPVEDVHIKNPLKMYTVSVNWSTLQLICEEMLEAQMSVALMLPDIDN